MKDGMEMITWDRGALCKAGNQRRIRSKRQRRTSKEAEGLRHIILAKRTRIDEEYSNRVSSLGWTRPPLPPGDGRSVFGLYVPRRVRAGARIPD